MQPSRKSLRTQVFQGFESFILRHYIPRGDWDAADLVGRRRAAGPVRIERLLWSPWATAGARADPAGGGRCS